MNRFEEGWVVIRSTLKFKLVLIFFYFPLSVYRALLLKEIILVQKWPRPFSLLNSKKWNKNDFLFKFSDVHLFYATLQWFGQRLNQNLHVKELKYWCIGTQKCTLKVTKWGNTHFKSSKLFKTLKLLHVN